MMRRWWVLPFWSLALTWTVTGCKSMPTQEPRGRVEDYWAHALEEVYRSPLELQAQHETELRRGIHLDKLMHGDPRRREVALTFDDGPHPDFTPRLLAILARYRVGATFFVVGKMAEAAPNLVQAEVAAGHDVGNHTYHHVNLTKIPHRLVAAEIQACGDVITSLTGQRPHLFRPPGGDYNRPVAETANKLGYKLILWTDDPADYADPGPSVVVRRTLDRLSNGGIILLHDGSTDTVQLLPLLLADIQRRGFRCVTIDEMIRQGR